MKYVTLKQLAEQTFFPESAIRKFIKLGPQHLRLDQK
jgi:hypothetical protein